MWELVATAAAGLNAGVSLEAAIAGSPSANDPPAFIRFVGRSRYLSLLLSTVSCGSAIAAHQVESFGTLWIVAAVGAGVSIPYNLLLMSAPRVTGTMPSMRPRAPVTFAEPPATAIPDTDAEAGLLGEGQRSAFAEAAAAKHSADLDTLDDMGMAPARAPAARRLMYAKSGVLVSPVDLSQSWSNKFWFQAALSLSVFGGMMAILASHKDNVSAAGGGYAPF